MDALSASSVVRGITSCSKQNILSCLSSMTQSDLQNILLIFLQNDKHPFMKEVVCSQWNSQWNDVHYPKQKEIECVAKIKDFFINKNPATISSTNNETNCSLIKMMPSSIAAHMISFCNMKDRLRYSLICKSFYKYCQIPMARQHLIIDHAFVKGLYYGTLDYTKYTHIKSLDVNYAFSDSPVSTNKYVGFQSTYYEKIAEILLKSPELHTINYRLTYKRFKYNLEENGVGDSMTGQVGHLFTWLDEIVTCCSKARGLFWRFLSEPDENHWDDVNLFKNVTKLIYTPSQPYFAHHWGWQREWRERPRLFYAFFPRLQSLVMPRTKLYKSGGRWQTINDYGDKDLEWFMFKQPYYYDTLQHLDVNMMPQYTTTQSRNEPLFHVNLSNHPLFHFYQFENLKSLQLKLPIFEECCTYYGLLWIDALVEVYGSLYCLQMQKLEIEFEMTAINDFLGKRNNLDVNVATDYKVVIAAICRYILSRCPNIIHFAVNTNGIVDGGDSFNYLMGYYGKLETVKTDCFGVFSDTRLLSLKKLVLTKNIPTENDNEKEIVNFDLFPNLEYFHIIYHTDTYTLDLNNNIVSFLTCLLNEKYSKCLKSVSITHTAKRLKGRRREFYRFKNVKHSSEKICKLITILTTSESNSINAIELNPVAIQDKECEFLSFWFSGRFGLFRAEQTSKKTKRCIFSNHQ